MSIFMDFVDAALISWAFVLIYLLAVEALRLLRQRHKRQSAKDKGLTGND